MRQFKRTEKRNQCKVKAEYGKGKMCNKAGYAAWEGINGEFSLCKYHFHVLQSQCDDVTIIEVKDG